MSQRAKTTAAKAKKPTAAEWKPASLLDDTIKLDKENFAYRWVNKSDEANLRKKKAEGWVPVSTLEGDRAQHERSENTSLADGSGLSDTISEYRELILMKMPKELNDSRKEYYKKINDQQMANMVEETKGQAPVTGSVTIGQDDNARVID